MVTAIVYTRVMNDLLRTEISKIDKHRQKQRHLHMKV